MLPSSKNLNLLNMVHVNSQKDMLALNEISCLACKFTVLLKKSHSLLDDPCTFLYIMVALWVAVKERFRAQHPNF